MYLKIKIFNIDMAKLAIKGHKTRGKEIIEILGMLGGKNQNIVYSGKDTFHYYFIDNETGYIRTKLYTDDYWTKLTYNIFTLEEFLEKFPYKVGDKVRCWINGYCSIDNIKDIQWDSITNEIKYKIQDYWYSTMNLQPYKEEDMETITIDDFKANTKEWLIDKLESMSKDNALQTINNIYDELHKPKYPKTYEECCKVLGYSGNYNVILTTDVDNKLFDALYRLKVCRDAYWKIAGEEMGLGKPWKPDWNDLNRKYFISLTCDGISLYSDFRNPQVLAFPTAEMRDAFYENFKDLIEQCKELL